MIGGRTLNVEKAVDELLLLVEIDLGEFLDDGSCLAVVLRDNINSRPI